MILPIHAYGHPILRKPAIPFRSNEFDLPRFIKDLFDTMYKAGGVGLAAPQAGYSLRVFVVDGQPMEGREGRNESMEGFVKTFINPTVLEEYGEKWSFEEGCLSIPGIRNGVMRHEFITLRYLDENMNQQEETFSGIKARIIQHEYDHLEGKLFTDYASPLKKQIFKPKLLRIQKGLIEPDYPMAFFK